MLIHAHFSLCPCLLSSPLLKEIPYEAVHRQVDFGVLAELESTRITMILLCNIHRWYTLAQAIETLDDAELDLNVKVIQFLSCCSRIMLELLKHSHQNSYLQRNDSCSFRRMSRDMNRYSKDGDAGSLRQSTEMVAFV